MLDPETVQRPRGAPAERQEPSEPAGEHSAPGMQAASLGAIVGFCCDAHGRLPPRIPPASAWPAVTVVVVVPFTAMS